jgi:hypothetical protein
VGDYQLPQLLIGVTARKLPVVNLEGEAYFFDFRLSQLRKVDEPHEFVDLSPNERRDFLEAVSYLELTNRFGNDPSSRVTDQEDA